MLYTYNMYMVLTPHTVRSQRARNDVVNNRCLHGRYAFLSMAPSPAAKVLRRVTGLSLFFARLVLDRRREAASQAEPHPAGSRVLHLS